jgi:hypothetical protein
LHAVYFEQHALRDLRLGLGIIVPACGGFGITQ